MIHCLRESLLYSEKRPRDMLFEVIEGALESKGADETPLTVCRLTRVMADRVRLSAARSGFEFSNWHIASRAVMNAMIHAGVLLTDDDVVIPAGVAAQAARILRVKRGYKDLTEAYLIEFLIYKLGDVSLRDHRVLAHVLFRQFDPAISMADLEDRVSLLIASLADRITISIEGVYGSRRRQFEDSITPITPPAASATLITP